MRCLINEKQLVDLIEKQLSNFFIIEKEEVELLRKEFLIVWDKIEKCFNDVDNKYFKTDGEVIFNPYHSGQYLIYLYFYSHIISSYDKCLADKIYYLNKIMHSCDIYHEVCLPKTFFLEHPVGTVLGRALYKDKFFAMQNCTVGGNKGIYPNLGYNLKMYSGSKILGNCTIGDNVVLAANTYIKDTDIPDNSLVFGASPNLIIKTIKL